MLSSRPLTTLAERWNNKIRRRGFQIRIRRIVRWRGMWVSIWDMEAVATGWLSAGRREGSSEAKANETDQGERESVGGRNCGNNKP